MREVAYRMGVLEAKERALPTTLDGRFVRAFYGRPAVAVEFLTMLGDRAPFTSGRDVALNVLGTVPDAIAYSPTRRRYPVVAWRMPLASAITPGQVRTAAARTAEWYGQQLGCSDRLDLTVSLERFRDAATMFERMLTVQLAALLIVVQPTYDALTRLVDSAGTGDVGLLSGSGGAEMVGLVGDIWKASRGAMSVDEVARRHGYHGPAEGELSSHVWREDPTPLLDLVAAYGDKPDSEDPAAQESARSHARLAARRELVRAVPVARRPLARAILQLSASRIPLRGVAKAAFLQAFDVARSSARQVGEQLAANSTIDEPDDVFYLTLDELRQLRLPPDVRELIELRRARRAAYERLEVPGHWRGMPAPTEAGNGDDDGGAVSGIGVSAGVVEGPARVMTSLDFSDVEPGEILVACTTDPSWSSIMFVSAGLVMDIGGALSHAAVVARELEIPCVVNTTNGTRAIRTGDRVRVDGGSGRVEILSRAA
jgi:pyruvate,water dikinase